ncbi:MAG: hypothetical protein LBG45_01820 [Dysgonamonadaceae bacterium]|jgi:hypothetical protein|nr:hypothetical protein [Dysgonamonadaceae bacterium]
MENKHLEAIPADVVKQVHDKLNEVKTLLLPYATPLTPTERRDLPKMGEKSLAFVEKSYDFAVENPPLVPSYLNMQTFGVDFSDAHGLWTVRNDASQVYEMLDDNVMLSGSESYQAALVFYNAVKAAAAHDVPGAKAIYEELKQRFPGHKRKPLYNGE